MYRSTRALLVAGIIADVCLAGVFYYRVPELVIGSLVALSFYLLELALLAYSMRKPWCETAAAWMFVLTVFVMVAVCAFNHQAFIEEKLRFEPFVGIKIIALFTPLFIPPKRWVAGLVLAALAAAPLIQYYSWSESARADLGVQEPWVTFLFVVCAAIVYELRLSLAETLLRERVLAEKGRLMEKVAHLLLGARHLMNTPLQTIEALLGMVVTRGSALAKRGERSFSTIRRTSDILAFAESYIRWSDVDLPHDTDELEFLAQEVGEEAGEFLQQWSEAPN